MRRTRKSALATTSVCSELSICHGCSIFDLTMKRIGWRQGSVRISRLSSLECTCLWIRHLSLLSLTVRSSPISTQSQFTLIFLVSLRSTVFACSSFLLPRVYGRRMCSLTAAAFGLLTRRARVPSCCRESSHSALSPHCTRDFSPHTPSLLVLLVYFVSLPLLVTVIHHIRAALCQLTVSPIGAHDTREAGHTSSTHQSCSASSPVSPSVTSESVLAP